MFLDRAIRPSQTLTIRQCELTSQGQEETMALKSDSFPSLTRSRYPTDRLSLAIYGFPHVVGRTRRVCHDFDGCHQRWATRFSLNTRAISTKDKVFLGITCFAPCGSKSYRGFHLMPLWSLEHILSASPYIAKVTGTLD